MESRPTKRGLGDYCFVIEFEGHVADEVVADCLADLQAHLARVKFLGSYPVTGEGAAIGATRWAQARLAAARWIEEIRARVRVELGLGPSFEEERHRFIVLRRSTHPPTLLESIVRVHQRRDVVAISLAQV